MRHHHSTDSRWGLRSKFVVFFEPDAPPIPQVSGLGLSWSTTISSARRRFKVKTSLSRTGVAVYINFWGMCFFADLDNADRRMAVLHTHYPALEAHLQLHRGHDSICDDDGAAPRQRRSATVFAGALWRSRRLRRRGHRCGRQRGGAGISVTCRPHRVDCGSAGEQRSAISDNERGRRSLV